MDTQQLYKILGVEEGATSDELKKAYRKLAREHHPDVGGDAEVFAQVSYAYRILNDPGSRLLYDTTGEPERPKIEKEVQGVLLRAFQDALKSDASQILVHARRFIEKCEERFKSQKQSVTQTRKGLVEKRDRIEVKEGVENVFVMLVDAEIKNCDGALSELEWKLEVAKVCYKALDDYSTKEREVPKFDAIVFWGSQPPVSYGELLDEYLKAKGKEGEHG